MVAEKKIFELIYQVPTFVSRTPTGLLEPGSNTYIDRINFSEVANEYGIRGLGFGLEKIDMARGTRKSIQQTMGTINDNGEVTDNFYEDTWYTAPPRIVLVGVVEMPAGKDDAIPVGYLGNSPAPNKSFLGTLEYIFRKSNTPQSVQSGAIIKFFDFFNKQSYRVSIKNYNTTSSIDRPNLMAFTLEMDIMEEYTTHGVDSILRMGGSTLGSENLRII